MSETDAPEVTGTKPLEECSLWRAHLWEEVERELAEMSGSNRAQYEAARYASPILPQEPISEPLEPQNQALPQAEWEQLYQCQMFPGFLSHKNPSEWEQTYREQGILEDHHENCVLDTHFEHGSPPPITSLQVYHIPNIPDGNQSFTCYFWLGGPVDLYNIPGCSEHLPITVSGDMKLIDVFDAYFSEVNANPSSVQPRDLELCNFIQIMFRDGKPQHGTQNYYQGAKRTGITVRDTQWYAWQKFWLVGSDREQDFLESCERSKAQKLPRNHEKYVV